jgi:hypothetical protein
MPVYGSSRMNARTSEHFNNDRELLGEHQI